VYQIHLEHLAESLNRVDIGLTTAAIDFDGQAVAKDPSCWDHDLYDTEMAGCLIESLSPEILVGDISNQGQRNVAPGDLVDLISQRVQG
jgi:hypothetical protein